MDVSGMLDDLPKAYDVGTKTNNKGYKTSWTGYTGQSGLNYTNNF